MIKPLGKRVLIKVQKAEVEKVTEAGLIIPAGSKSTFHRAIVIAVSDDVKTVKEGDTVLVGQYGGHVIDANPADVRALYPEEEILAIES